MLIKKWTRFDTFLKIYPFIKQQNSSCILLLMLQTLLIAIQMVPPYLYGLLIDKVIVHQKYQVLPIIIAGYFLAYLIETVLISINKRLENKIFKFGTLKIKRQLMRIFTSKHCLSKSHYSIGDLKNRIENDVTVIEKFLIIHIFNFIISLINFIVLIFIMGSINIGLLFIGLIASLFSFSFLHVLKRKVWQINENKRILQGDFENFLHNSLQSWRDIQTNNLEEKQFVIFQEYRKKLSSLFYKNQIYWYINRAFLAFKKIFLSKLLLYFFGGLLSIYKMISISRLLVFIKYFNKYISNISSILDSILSIQQDIPCINKVLEILKQNTQEEKKLMPTGHWINLNHLYFQYENTSNYVLQDLTLTIPYGTKFAIVGTSGSGKSTLAKIIAGIYTPTTGSICLGGLNMSHLAGKAVAKKIGIVTQEPYLFNMSIRENLLLVKKNATIDEIENACNIANITQFIHSLPEGLDTIIGENGVQLSLGQKQRIAIARIILQAPDIYILDEATSALDRQNEQILLENLKQIVKGKTVITITHQLLPLVASDTIAVIKQGKLDALGTHAELLSTNKQYRQIFQSQLTQIL